MLLPLNVIGIDSSVNQGLETAVALELWFQGLTAV